MTKKVHSPHEAAQLLAESLATFPAASSAYVPSFEDSSAYLASRHAELSAAAIAPVAVVVQPDAVARAFGPWEDREYRMFIVARLNTQVLLVNAETGGFSLGHVDAEDRVSLLGFASDDALAEWVS